jgi:hypothetical protein
MVYQLILLAIFLIVVLFVGHVLLYAVRKQHHELMEMKDAIKQIAASKRLSTYLSIEAKKGLVIAPEQFEANKVLLEKKMLDELEEQIRRNRMASDPSGAATLVKLRTGFSEFVEWETANGFSSALSRLFANNDIDAARKLIKDAVAAL